MLINVVSWIIIFLGLLGVKHIDRKQKKERRAAWFFIFAGFFCFALNVVLEVKEEMLLKGDAESCIQCKERIN